MEINGGLREDIGMKTYLHGPMDHGKKLKLRFRVGNLDLPERRKRRTSSREEGMDAHIHVPVWHNNREQDSHSRRM